MTKRAYKLAAIAVEQTRLAYLFNPGSYTHSAFVAALAMRDESECPNWIEEFLSWNNSCTAIRNEKPLHNIVGRAA